MAHFLWLWVCSFGRACRCYCMYCIPPINCQVDGNIDDHTSPDSLFLQWLLFLKKWVLLTLPRPCLIITRTSTTPKKHKKEQVLGPGTGEHRVYSNIEENVTGQWKLSLGKHMMSALSSVITKGMARANELDKWESRKHSANFRPIIFNYKVLITRVRLDPSAWAVESQGKTHRNSLPRVFHSSNKSIMAFF